MYTHQDFLADSAARLLARDIQEARHEMMFADGKAHERIEREYRRLCSVNEIQRGIVNAKYAKG